MKLFHLFAYDTYYPQKASRQYQSSFEDIVTAHKRAIELVKEWDDNSEVPYYSSFEYVDVMCTLSDGSLEFIMTVENGSE